MNLSKDEKNSLADSRVYRDNPVNEEEIYAPFDDEKNNEWLRTVRASELEKLLDLTIKTNKLSATINEKEGHNVVYENKDLEEIYTKEVARRRNITTKRLKNITEKSV